MLGHLLRVTTVVGRSGMLDHLLRVTTVVGRSGHKKKNYERKVFLTCADDCDCCDKFHGKLLWPVKLEILERHLEKVTLDKF
jgi:hypothetical protein